MIHVVTYENRELYRRQLQEMHALRKTHFIQERGWTGLTERDGGEYDAYDDEKTIYFFALDQEGRIGVSMRARPTQDKSMLGDIFPHLIGPGAAPVEAPGVWEISRIFATRRFRTRSGVRRRSELFLATVEAAAIKGIDRLVGMTDVFLLPQTLAAGGPCVCWACRPPMGRGTWWPWKWTAHLRAWPPFRTGSRSTSPAHCT
jgi:N-acyl-L-homoserine lactone synthetase